LFDPHQHAYRDHFSCETALLTIHQHAATAIGSGEVMILAALDLSAAFDMVNHELLCAHCHAVGIKGKALLRSLTVCHMRLKSLNILCSMSPNLWGTTRIRTWSAVVLYYYDRPWGCDCKISY
jgi:hypothetical protein